MSKLIVRLFASALLCVVDSSFAGKVELDSFGVGAQRAGILYVSAVEAEKILNSHTNVVVLDVRTAQEHRQSRIADGINIDYYASNFAQQLTTLDKNQIYLVHCRSGVRSGKSLTILKQLGFKNIIHLDGGMLAWSKALTAE